MAETDSGGLLVQIGVTQARMERELAKLVKDAGKSAGDMEKSFTAANTNIGKSATSAYGAMAKGAASATPAIKNTSGATANLASQLNDIGVQLAGGQSPFLIMIQQGTQISQLFNQQGGTIRSFGSLLAGAVTSALNPFSLLTFAVIGLGGAAIQYFAGLISGGEDANKTLEEQQKLIESIGKSWGAGIPAVDAYIAKLNEAKDAADALAATKILTADIAAPTTKIIESLSVEFAGLKADLIAFGDDGLRVVGDLGTKFETLRKNVGDGKATQEDFNAVIEAAQAASATGINGIEGFIKTVNSLRAAALGAANEVARLNASIGPATNAALNDPNTWRGRGSIGNPEGALQNSSDPDLPMDGPKPDSRPSDLDSDRNRGVSKPKAAKAARGANAFKDEVAGIKERTAALRESTAAQAGVNPLITDYGFALEKAKAEQKLLADAQRAGMAITPQLRDQISELAGSYAASSAEAKKLAESQADVKKQAEAWASLEKDVFKGFITDLKDGKSGAEALSNALNKVADKLLDMALDGLFSTKGGGAGGGSGIFSSLLGGIGKLFGVGFASGTANTGGRRGQPAGVVHGEEAVIPLPAGGKVPVTISSPNTNAMAKQASRDVVELRLADDSGRMADIADQRIHTASGTIVKISVDQSYKTVKSNMAGLMTDAQSRN